MRSEPRQVPGGEAEHFAAYLRFYRDTVVEKCTALPDGELRASRLPSGWSPLELLHHLTHMERRWFVWGFLAEPVDEPWGDSGGDPEQPWRIPEGVRLDDVVAMLGRTAGRTDEILATTALDTRAATGGRFAEAGEQPPTLRWICFHVLQEYARHAGHLDVAVELAGGPVGE